MLQNFSQASLLPVLRLKSQSLSEFWEAFRIYFELKNGFFRLSHDRLSVSAVDNPKL